MRVPLLDLPGSHDVRTKQGYIIHTARCGIWCQCLPRPTPVHTSNGVGSLLSFYSHHPISPPCWTLLPPSHLVFLLSLHATIHANKLCCSAHGPFFGQTGAVSLLARKCICAPSHPDTLTFHFLATCIYDELPRCTLEPPRFVKSLFSEPVHSSAR